jgi:hypothetical protein
MRTRQYLLAAILVAVLLVGSFVVVVQGQDTGVSSQGIVCDSTLLLLLYLAERDYGFTPASDLTTFELGQFRSRFDELSTASEESTAGDEEAGTEGEGTAAEGEGGDSSGTTTFQLLPGDVSGEDAACTQLRSEVYEYLVTQGNIDQGADASGG